MCANGLIFKSASRSGRATGAGVTTLSHVSCRFASCLVAMMPRRRISSPINIPLEVLPNLAVADRFHRRKGWVQIECSRNASTSGTSPSSSI